MNRILCASIASLMALVLSCAKEASSRPHGEDAAFAETVVETLGSQGYQPIVRLMHYPQEETGERLVADQSGVERLLLIAETELGRVSKIRPAQGVPDSVDYGVGGGTTDYWAKHPGNRRYIYATRFDRRGDGWIFVDISPVGDAPSIKTIWFAIPRTEENAIVIGRMLQKAATNGRDFS